MPSTYNTTGRGRGKRASGRSPGRSMGRGRGRKSNNSESKATTGTLAQAFSKSLGIDTNLPQSNNKRNSAQRSPLEGGTLLKKPAPFSTSSTDVDASSPPSPQGSTRAISSKTSKTTTSTNTSPYDTEASQNGATASSSITIEPNKLSKGTNSTLPTTSNTARNTAYTTTTTSSIYQPTKHQLQEDEVLTTHTDDFDSCEDHTYDIDNTSNDEDDSFDSEEILDEAWNDTNIDNREVYDLKQDRITHGDHEDPAGFVTAETEERIRKRRNKRIKERDAEPVLIKAETRKPKSAIYTPASSTALTSSTALPPPPPTPSLTTTPSSPPLPSLNEPSKQTNTSTSIQNQTSQSLNMTPRTGIDNPPPPPPPPSSHIIRTIETTDSESRLKYKRVNHISRNRREPSNSRSKTPDATNRTRQQFTFETRITFKMSIKPTVEPLQTIRSITKQLLTEMSHIDDKLVLLPWNQKSTSSPITNTMSMPDSVTAIYKYLHKLFVPRNAVETTIYPQLRLGHEMDFTTLREGIYPWVQSLGHGIFYNMLQAEDSTELGWLLYSTREMDTGALADEITDTIGINVGLRWKVISNGQKKMNKDNMVRALSIEISAKHKWQGQQKLLKLYSRAIKRPEEYPNGVRLRFVKLKTSSVNKIETSKLDKLRDRQKKFLASICSSSCNEIVHLDYSINAGEIPTLRQMIMNLRSINTQEPLFHCVDLDWRSEGFTFQFSPALKEEAETTINTLLPLLTKSFPDADVDSNFDENAIFRCQHMVWDEKRKMVIDLVAPEDSAHIEEEENLAGFIFDIEAVKDAEKRPSTDIPVGISPHADNDSVSTLRSRDGTARHTQHQPQRPSSRTPSSATVSSQNTSLSNSSYATLDSRITSLASQVQAQQNNNALQFNAIMNALTQLTNSQPKRPDQATDSSASNVRGNPSLNDGTSDDRS